MPVLHSREFVLFRLRQLVNLTDLGVGEFLHLFETIALVVFRNLFVFQHLLQTLIGVAPDIANCRAVIFRDFVDLFRELFAAFGCRISVSPPGGTESFARRACSGSGRREMQAEPWLSLA